MKLKKQRIMALCFLLPACAANALAGTSLTANALKPEAKISKFYRFEAFSLRSVDQQRHYKITIATPKAAMPKQGYPVLYMLDGNAALPALTDAVLARLQSDDWPVIVTLGYEEGAKTARVYDYTPQILDNVIRANMATDDMTTDSIIRENKVSVADAQYGGAEQFGQFIEQAVKPQVTQRVNIDTTRQTLWGHSFGGLYVLHTLFHHPASFQRYIAVDPSLWWQQGQILAAEQAFSQRGERPTVELLIQRSASHRPGDTLPKDETRRLAQRLSQLPELTVQYYDYFQHHHGSVRAASLPAALRMAQGIEQQ